MKPRFQYYSRFETTEGCCDSPVFEFVYAVLDPADLVYAGTWSAQTKFRRVTRKEAEKICARLLKTVYKFSGLKPTRGLESATRCAQLLYPTEDNCVLQSRKPFFQVASWLFESTDDYLDMWLRPDRWSSESLDSETYKIIKKERG